MEKVPFKNFEEPYIKAKVTRNGKQCDIYNQINNIGKSVSIFTTNKPAIGTEAALSYPVIPVCLPLPNGDGSKWRTNKSILYSTAMNDLKINSVEELPPAHNFLSRRP